jgi:hypothetical protein
VNPIGELVSIPISSRWWARGTLLAVRLTRTKDELSWHLRLGDGAPLSEEQYDQFVPAPELNAVRERIGALLRDESPSGATVVESGQAIYRLLVPRPLRDVLPTFAGTLLLEHPPDLAIPWEMLHDGRDFWGRRWSLGRSPLGDFSLHAQLQPQGGRHQMLVVGGSTPGKTSFLDERMREMGDVLAAGGRVVTLSGRHATARAIRRALQSHYDVIHVCGAASPDLKLLVAADGEYPLDELVHAESGHPLVVLDLLVEGRDPVGTPLDSTPDRELARTARMLLARGAIGVVARIAGRFDRSDRVVFDRFYRQVFDGVVLGEALRVARAAHTDATGQETVAAVSLGLYGHPDSALRKRARIKQWHPFPKPSARASRLRRTIPVLAAAAAAFIWMSPALRSALPQTPARFEVVVVDPGDEETRALLRDVAMVLQDGLAAVGRAGGTRIEMVPPRQVLCEHRGSTPCAALLGEARPIQLVMARDATAQSVRVDGVMPDGAPASVSARTVERLDGGLAGTDLLGKVILQLHLSRDAATATKASASKPMADAYGLLRASLDETVAVPMAPDRAAIRRMAPLPLLTWPQMPFGVSASHEDVLRLLDRYEAALERGVVDEVALFQPGMRRRQRDALTRYLDRAKGGLDVEFEDVDVTIAGNDAIVSASRVDRLSAIAPDGLLPVRVALQLRRRDGEWRVVEPPTPMRWGVLTERLEAFARRGRATRF